MSPWSAIAAPARRSCSPRCSSMPALSTASAASTTARRSPTTTKKRSPASTPSSASLAYVEWNRTKINFIDTPGMANFLSDARAALRVSDAALVVVDAVSGVQVSTEKVWSIAAEMEAPRLVVLNRLDRERASLEPRARLAARRLRPHGDPDADSDRRGEGLPRRRRSRRDEGLDVRDRRQRQAVGSGRFPTTWPQRHRPRATRSSRWSPKPTMP